MQEVFLREGIDVRLAYRAVRVEHDDAGVVVAYDRRTLDQTGRGHFSGSDLRQQKGRRYTRGGIGPGVLPPLVRTAGSAGVTAALLLRGIGDFRYVGLFKRERATPFGRMDTRLYTPLVLGLAALAGIVAARGS